MCLRVDKNKCKEVVSFRFRLHKEYEIDTLEAEQIFLCKPSIDEDSGDCEILFDIQDLCRYFILEMKPKNYSRFSAMFDDDFYDEIMEKVKGKPAYEALKGKIRVQAFIAMLSRKKSAKICHHTLLFPKPIMSCLAWLVM